MARSFSASEYFTTTTTSYGTSPITLAAWFYPTDDATSFQGIISHTDEGNNGPGLNLFFNGNVANDPLIAQANTSGGADNDSSITGINFNAWNHGAGVFASSTSRTVYLNGVAGTENTGNIGTVSTYDRISIGGIVRASVTANFSGRIGHAAAWAAALTAEEIASLARRFSPLLIRPDSLIDYWPLRGNSATDDEIGLLGAHVMSQNNSPGVADGPPIIYPRRSRHVFPPALAARTASAGQSLSIGQNADSVVVAKSSAAQSLAIGQSASAAVEVQASASQNLQIGQSASLGIEVQATAAQTLSIGQASNTKALVKTSATQSLGIGQSAEATSQVASSASADQALSVGQSASTAVQVKASAAQSLGIGQFAIIAKTRELSADQSLGVSQVVNARHATERIADVMMDVLAGDADMKTSAGSVRGLRVQ